MASDNLTSLILGALDRSEKVSNLLLEDVLARRRAKEMKDYEMETLPEKTRIQEESQIRIRKAIPQMRWLQNDDGTWSQVEGAGISRLPIQPQPRETPEQTAEKARLVREAQNTADKNVPPTRSGMSAEIRTANDLRKEFINRPEVKDYVTVNTNVRSMDSLLIGALSGNMNNKVALDQGLVTMYNKLTDPNSVVRESEYARTPENLPTVNRISGALQKVFEGGAGLTDADREALVIGAKIIANERGKTFQDLRTEYEGLSRRYNIDSSLVTATLPEFKAFGIEKKKENKNLSLPFLPKEKSAEVGVQKIESKKMLLKQKLGLQ